MATISISEEKWNAVSAEDKKRIAEHLIKYKMMNPGDSIAGSATAEGFFDDINPGKILCLIACDAAAAAAIVALTLTGPALAAAIAAIAVIRDACRNGC